MYVNGMIQYVEIASRIKMMQETSSLVMISDLFYSSMLLIEKDS